MFFYLGLSFIVGSLTAFVGWSLNMLNSELENISFGNWYIVFYVMAGLIVLAGIIDFIRTVIIICRRGGRRGGKSGIGNLPKQGHKH